MVFISNSFEGGTNGAAITTGNSGGIAANDPFNLVSSTAPTFDTTKGAHGTTSMRIATGATAVSSYVEWNTALGTTSLLHWRINMFLTEYPLASTTLFRAQSGSTIGGSMSINTSGVLRIVSSSSQTVSLPTAAPLGKWFRVEGKMTASATAGTCELRRYDEVDQIDTSPTDVITGTGQVYTASFNTYRLGLLTSTANSIPMWYDDIALSTTAWIGPEGTPTSPPPAATAPPANTAAPTITGAAQVGGTLTSTTGTWTNNPAYTRQWQANGVNISGATNTTYIPVTGDLGKTISVVVTATNSAGSATAVSGATGAVVAAGTGSTLAYWYENPNKTIPPDADYYTNSGSLASAITAAGSNGTLVLDYTGTRVEDINMALPNGITIMNAPGKKPWVDGTIRVSGGEGTKIWGLNVKCSNPAPDDHILKLDGGSPEWGYSELTMVANTVGSYGLVRPGQAVHDWRVHHCFIHDNPGVSSHDGNQDHGLYASAENASQNGRVDHCLIEDMPRGRNIKIGGPASSASPIGDIVIDHNTLRRGLGPSNGQISNSTENTSWHHNILIDSGAETGLTEGAAARPGNTYSFNKADRVVGPATSNFVNAGNNTNSLTLAVLTDYVTQGTAGFGHLEGASAGGGGGGTSNTLPVANAGPDQTGRTPGATVTLTGSGTDADGTVVSYTWTQTGGQAVTLSGTDNVRTFVAPAVIGGTTLTFSLTVTDNAGATSAPDTVTVGVNAGTTGGTTPTARVGITIDPFNPFTLTGTAPTGTVASYNWTQTGGPAVALVGTGPSRTFTPPATTTGTTLTFSLTVTDTNGLTSVPDTFTMVVRSVTEFTANGGAWVPIYVTTVTSEQTGGGDNAPVLQEPNAPATLTSTATTATSISLSWAAATVPTGSPAVTNYRVYNNSTNVLLATLGNVTSTTISGLASSTTYTFNVRAVNTVGESTPSPVRTVATQAPATPPPPDPVVTPPSTGTGVWISAAEIAALPTSGTAWSNVQSAANASWGSPNLADNNSQHDTYTLAGALVGKRLNDSALITKTRNALKSVSGSGYARVLEMSRQIPCYVIAADIVGFATTAEETTFKNFMNSLRTKSLSGHSGGGNMLETARFSANNWGTMSRGAMCAIDRYIGNTSELALMGNVHRRWCGETPSGFTSELDFGTTSWHSDSPKNGINKAGATISTRDVSGVIPEDQRRTGESFAWPAPKGSYPWEALQGAVVAGRILDRAGVASFNCGNNALRRAVSWLTNVNGNPASGDDLNTPWIVNAYGGTFSTSTPTSMGKNMAWADWTK